MTTIEEFESRLADLLDEVRAVSATPRAAVNPDGTPGYVAAGELIESAWGNATVDSIQNLLLPNQIGALTHATGKLQIKSQQLAAVATNPTGDGQVGFPAPYFTNTPVVIATALNPSSPGHVLGIFNVAVDYFWFHVSLASTGGAVANTSVGVAYLAIGRR